ncbi:MAG: type I polyketide synthase [Bacillota bacterium]|nr:type I polyketide synthase [Bacillota bacterium]
MLNKLVDFKEIKTCGEEDIPKIERVSNKDIAVIGVYGKFPMADNMDEFWQNLRNGIDCIREFPDERMKDINSILPNSYMSSNPPLCKAAYLDDVDKFDYEFFNLSPSEARLMDPNQRLFLEAAWSVIDEAGYGGNVIRGTKTGVYVGHSSDLKFEYHMYVNTADMDMYNNISLPGNVKSIIASRISYMLDLKGPSMVVDTACSSSLVAVHLACQGILNGECEMAIAGGVKINLLPIQKGIDDEIGIRSPGDKAKTFDDSSDGTGSGEGVIAIMLKTLKKAIDDGDHIHAVIKGSAINQDGNSIGLTAPNSEAQEAVILDAWKNADIDPETISYIEAHGTATKLGDPIEINGIERAFKKHTSKKNFCAIGSVKTNIGHLDNISGLAGLVKLILSLKHKAIPASLHFSRPNRKINFIDSPVFVNDRLVKWATSGFPLRGGVSSFGLAGTNCHVVVEEYKKKEVNLNISKTTAQIFTLSAQSKEVLSNYVDKYIKHLDKDAESSIEDICYTANAGRQHYTHRLAIIAENKEILREKLESFKFGNDKTDDIYYGKHRIVSANQEDIEQNAISENTKRTLENKAAENIEKIVLALENKEASLREICNLYINGADIEWKAIYRGQSRKKVSLPVYPFKRSRCWIETKAKVSINNLSQAKEISHPLVDRCIVKTFGQEIYAVRLNIDSHWVLGEHKVAGRCVLPGTAYLEIIREIFSKHIDGNYTKLQNILFVSPLIVEANETKEVHIIVKEKEGYYDFTIASKSDSGHGWNIHVEGKAQAEMVQQIPEYDIDAIFKNSAMEEMAEEDERKIIVEIGPRWTGIKKRTYKGQNNEYIAHFKIPEEFENDLKEYYIYPPVMDRSINAANALVGEGTYLPLSYKTMIIYGASPKEFYSYIRPSGSQKGNLETLRFDVLLFDKTGKVFVEVKDYTIKRVRENEFKLSQLKESKDMFHQVVWNVSELGKNEKDLIQGDILLFKGKKNICEDVANSLKAEGCNLIQVELGDRFEKLSQNEYIISAREEDYKKLMAQMSQQKLSNIIHMSTLDGASEIENIQELEHQQNNGVLSLFHLTRALIANKFSKELDIILISDYANQVTKFEESIKPHNMSIFALGKVVKQEYLNLKSRCIDIDDNTSADEIVAEIKAGGDSYQCAYREGARYIDEFKELNIARQEDKAFEIKEQGVYLITGGIGGLGLEISKFIASKNKVKLALINRSSMPARETWDDILRAAENKKMCRAIKAIRRIEVNGAEVLCYSADTANFNEMEQVVTELREKYGVINGIVHCAGLAGDGFIYGREEKIFKNVIAPKTQGTWILDKLTKSDELDFFVLFSSITSILGGQGQGDYTAANSYLDSFTAYRNKQGKRTITINWPAWKEVGMAADYGVEDSKNTLKAVSTDIAITIFGEILSKEIERVIIGEPNYGVLSEIEEALPINLAHKIRLGINEHRSNKKDTSLDNKARTSAVLIKGGSKEDVFSETEKKIAGIWSEILGLEEVDIYDNFNSLGGDSILATRLLRKLEKEYPGMIDIADVFAYSTVNAMAQYIEEIINKEAIKDIEAKAIEEDLLDDLLEKLANGDMEIAEADKYF